MPPAENAPAKQKKAGAKKGPKKKKEAAGKTLVFVLFFAPILALEDFLQRVNLK